MFPQMLHVGGCHIECGIVFKLCLHTHLIYAENDVKYNIPYHILQLQYYSNKI